MPAQLNHAIMRLSKRAESQVRQTLIDTFVEAGALTTLLSTTDHQIMYGRRGTGKTHALQYIANTELINGNCPVYIDLRTIGSSVGLYANHTVPLAERATRLLVDVMLAFHGSLLEFAVSDAEGLQVQRAGPILDEFGDGVTELRVVGEVADTTTDFVRKESESSKGSSIGAVASPKPAFKVATDRQDSQRIAAERTASRAQSGTEVHYVHFGRLGAALRGLAELWAPRQLWLLLDEWSSVPFDLQPYLADLLRRSVLPVGGVVVKIAAIEGRVNFRLQSDHTGYIGVEVGADMTANVNLDDFMVFDNNAKLAMEFFQTLFFRHIRSLDDGAAMGDIPNPIEFVRRVFTQVTAFEEFVRASEGVPRDAMNILASAATQAGASSIGVDHIRVGAQQWYQRDKQAAVSSNAESERLLHWIIDEVIRHRRARAFLLSSSIRDPLIENLYDERVLHILKRGVSSHDDPGMRYDVYKLDYGCYVDLLTTQQAPQGLLPSDDSDGKASFVQVPPDDYRSIRRAILRLDEFRAIEA